jgi:hypothetical protein
MEEFKRLGAGQEAPAGLAADRIANDGKAECFSRYRGTCKTSGFAVPVKGCLLLVIRRNLLVCNA